MAAESNGILGSPVSSQSSPQPASQSTPRRAIAGSIAPDRSRRTWFHPPPHLAVSWSAEDEQDESAPGGAQPESDPGPPHRAALVHEQYVTAAQPCVDYREIVTLRNDT
ncbi:hypothetical protein PCL_00838 [Purpureocillium lilacinum]|uniref:Uncharacterized protein n=1 Tax=Purpureocillium lilacinum TaxID=33203 RepID=A0A2U3E3V1_PURLI|nr:hypothetical protein PCL_00838 [Purpureocillium lilacinum]